MRKTLIAAAALLATLATPSTANAQVCNASNDDILMLYEAAIVSPMRCTGFKPIPIQVKLSMLKAAGVPPQDFVGTSCQNDMLTLRLRIEAIADNDITEFCRFNRSVFLGDQVLKHFITGSASKPKN